MNKLKNAFIKLVNSLYHKFNSDIPSLDKQLCEIMENFDFNKVAVFMSWNKSHRIYDKDDVFIEEPWKLYNHDTSTSSVPTESELKNLASRMLTDTIKLYDPKDSNKQVVWLATGPFKTVCRYGILELMCVIEYWSYD